MLEKERLSTDLEGEDRHLCEGSVEDHMQGPQRQPARKWGPQPYSCKELNSADSPWGWKRTPACHWQHNGRLEQETQVARPRLPTTETEMPNVCCFMLRSLQLSVGQQKKNNGVCFGLYEVSLVWGVVESTGSRPCWESGWLSGFSETRSQRVGSEGGVMPRRQKSSLWEEEIYLGAEIRKPVLQL